MWTTVSRLFVNLLSFFNLIPLFCCVEEGVCYLVPSPYSLLEAAWSSQNLRTNFIKLRPRRQRFYLYKLKLSETNLKFGPPSFLQLKKIYKCDFPISSEEIYNPSSSLSSVRHFLCFLKYNDIPYQGSDTLINRSKPN